MICIKCGFESDDDELFHKDNKILTNRCRKCHNEQVRQWKLKTGRLNYKGSKNVETNQRFGKLIAKDYVVAGKGQRSHKLWRCVCDCGGEINVTQSILVNGRKSCGCLNTQNIGNKHHCWKGFGCISGSVILRAKHGAKHRNLEFTIDIEYLHNLYIKQCGKCSISGVELVLPNSSQDFKTGKATASLDRIDSNKGYIEGNVHWIHKDVNKMKMEFNQDYFIKMCKLIAENNK